ncbi:MAG TPA: DinB family protein [Ktedonobacteraceae bacterium]|nr:DinB family protein [Ktedonobacteraceae bacterium]
MTTDNPQIEEIRHKVRTSYDALTHLIEGPLAQVDPKQLYRSPGGEEWTVMENLAHIVEFMPYWADEVAKLVAQPGQNFGRTMQHEGRLRALQEHAHDSLQEARTLLPQSYAHLDRVLSSLKESDLELTGHHSKFGDKKLAWFIEEFITEHLASHLEQLKSCL